MTSCAEYAADAERVELQQANSSTPNSNIHFALSKLCLQYFNTVPYGVKPRRNVSPQKLVLVQQVKIFKLSSKSAKTHAIRRVEAFNITSVSSVIA